MTQQVSAKSQRLEVVARFPNALVHAYDPNLGLIYSCKDSVFTISDLGKPKPINVGRIPWGWREMISHARIADRFLKNAILQVVHQGDGRFLVSNGKRWWCLPDPDTAIPVKAFSTTRPMNRGICVSTHNQCTYVAEYFSNPDRHPVRIFRSNDLENYTVAWAFAANEIRHVHAILEDPEIKQRIWVLTGDLDHESSFYYTEDDFKTLQRPFAEGQTSRATDMIIRNGQIIWGMDSPSMPSSILMADKEHLADAKHLFSLPGPAYYMCQNQAGGIYVGTTSEPGDSVLDSDGHLIANNPEGVWEDCLQLKKDVFPQFGIFYFPRGELPGNYLVYSQRALKPWEGYMTIVRDLAWS